MVGNHQGVDLAGLDEALCGGVSEEAEQVVEEPVHVEDPAGLVVDAQLRPRDGLHELLVRPEPAREHDKGIRQIRHERLALVHGAHHVQVAQRLMGDLVTRQRLGDDAGGPSARRQGGVGHHTHQAHRGAAVDELKSRAGPPWRRIARRPPRRRDRHRGSSRRRRTASRRPSCGAAFGDRNLLASHGGGSPDATDDGLGRIGVVNGEREGRSSQGEDRGDQEREAVARDVGRRGARMRRAPCRR